eukprot:scaffold5131_cov68-Phaeocystis_antarctica.AAC.3
MLAKREHHRQPGPPGPSSLAPRPSSEHSLDALLPKTRGGAAGQRRVHGAEGADPKAGRHQQQRTGRRHHLHIVAAAAQRACVHQRYARNTEEGPHESGARGQPRLCAQRVRGHSEEQQA